MNMQEEDVLAALAPSPRGTHAQINFHCEYRHMHTWHGGIHVWVGGYVNMANIHTYSSLYTLTCFLSHTDQDPAGAAPSPTKFSPEWPKHWSKLLHLVCVCVCVHTQTRIAPEWSKTYPYSHTRRSRPGRCSAFAYQARARMVKNG